MRTGLDTPLVAAARVAVPRGAVLSAIATVLLVPPVNLACLALFGLLLARRRPVAGLRLALAAQVALLLLALPAVSGVLLAALQGELAAPAVAAAPQAIVILGGDATAAGPRPEQTDIGTLSLERERAAALLARRSGLPVLVTGGVVTSAGAPVAELMARSLAADFSVPVRWVEPMAANTWENAALSAALLRRDGITSVFVVTHAWHMRRALIAFRAAGLAAVPAPLPGERMPRFGPGDFIPRASSWERSYFALHEWIGCAWYALRAWRAPAAT